MLVLKQGAEWSALQMVTVHMGNDASAKTVTLSVGLTTNAMTEKSAFLTNARWDVAPMSNVWTTSLVSATSVETPVKAVQPVVQMQSAKW